MWVVAQATILVTYAVVIGYGLAWFCNTAFYLGARWAWITKLYWLFDITIGLITVSYTHLTLPTKRIV